MSKWGEYIGKHNPQCEYLYDEVGIEQVYCYHVYEKVKVLAITDLKHGEYYGTSGMSSFFDGVRWDGQAGKFKAFVYDDDTKEMVIRELEYSPQWFEYTREPVFAPVFVWQEPIRRPIRFDNEPPLLES